VDTLAVVLEAPQHLVLRRLGLNAPAAGDVVVDVAWTGVSTGTERLLWTGEMPPFPGLSYPLVPGYEAMGQIEWAGEDSGRSQGEWVFVPGSRAFQGAQGLFGASAARLVTAGPRAIPVPVDLGEEACLLALAATALHAVRGSDPGDRTLVVGHGALGRLVARILCLRPAAAPPVVWETQAVRRGGSTGYPILHPDEDPGHRYHTIYDLSGDPEILDRVIPLLEQGGEVVLAGFYDQIRFAFPSAFLREARIRVAAEWRPKDLQEVLDRVAEGDLDLGGLVTHRSPAAHATGAYRTAFEDPTCVKMILDWRTTS